MEGMKETKGKKGYKLTKEQLMSGDGLAKICTTLKKFRILGVGREEETLEKLIDTYYIWAHELHPRATFPEIISSVSKLSHDKDVKKAYISLLKSEYRIFSGPENEQNSDGPAEDIYEDDTREAQADDAYTNTGVVVHTDTEDDIIAYRNQIRKRVLEAVDLSD